MEKVSICICTRNRVNDLKNAINSIFQSTYTNFELVVSDDSTNDDTKIMIEQDFQHVKYLKGPQKGLCSNRNNALREITGTRVLFMDDDVIMSKEFLHVIMNKLLQLEPKLREKTIITGLEMNNGNLVHPNKINFLGHQKKTYKKEESLKTIVINSTLFPSSLLQKIKFDECLVYGYDEVDIASRAISAGYCIILCREAINEHYPSNVNRDFYSLYIEASRIYVTYKRYKEIESKYLKSIAYLYVSFFHMLLHQLQRKKIKGIGVTISTFKKAFSYINLSKKYKNEA
ncbi:glycosyltransferase [Niallia taxi]|nr:glycosyltransferase [Niallia taxi]MDE5053926.1 glycosyltransferase [Niallia taxi]